MSGELPTIPLDLLTWLTATGSSWMLGKLLAGFANNSSRVIEPDDLRSQATVEIINELPTVLFGALILSQLITSQNTEVQAYSVPVSIFLISYLNTGIRSILKKFHEEDSVINE